MFSDVLAALRHAKRVDAIAVVTSDYTAETLSLELATVLPDDAQAGQSDAAEIGIGHAIAAGYERALLAPGDTPLIDPGDIDLLLDRSARDGLAVAIVADRHGTGTNALVLTPPDALRPAFAQTSPLRVTQIITPPSARRTSWVSSRMTCMCRGSLS